jgi:uncharacterized protein involved in response to NO
MIECVMAGRVIPAFTMAVTSGLKLVAPVWLEWVTLDTTGLGLAFWASGPPSVAGLMVLVLASVLHVRRLLSWCPAVTLKRPILWILHAAYAWIPVGLGLLALAQVGWVPVSADVHALAVAATGGFIIGMITRTARATPVDCWRCLALKCWHVERLPIWKSRPLPAVSHFFNVD